ncbi:unnamed protein product [Blepharisma stoltei]|uniref:Kelch motif family protein n=1 Tax=Blepharisma stoltei TaxID=1481888 RepID=A0AAU9K2C1_9CILI|nr:unnamed protein product [Blepharisma stoltei]
MNPLDIPEELNRGTCIAQLPNGDLFCYGKDPSSGISLIIDKNCKIQMLPPGTPCAFSSAVYFEKRIYCFGGLRYGPLTLAEWFDLEKQKWISLKSIPDADLNCHCIVYNGEILIAGSINANILRYSINYDKYTKIHFKFEQRKRKILINLDRLYLIEFGGFVYESEIANPNKWNQIGMSRISNNHPAQVNCSYNKGAIYIAVGLSNESYYKFDLNKKKWFNLNKEKIIL